LALNTLYLLLEKLKTTFIQHKDAKNGPV